MPLLRLEKTPRSDRIAVSAPEVPVEVAVCAFSRGSVSERVRLASCPDACFETIVHYDGDSRKFLDRHVALVRPSKRYFEVDILHERPLAEVHLRLVGRSGKATVARVPIDKIMPK